MGHQASLLTWLCQLHGDQQMCCPALARSGDLLYFRHLPKCFDNVHNLEFKKDDKGDPTKTAVGMYSGEHSLEPASAIHTAANMHRYPGSTALTSAALWMSFWH